MRDITLCHPRLQKLAAKLVEECAGQGLKIQIGETLRTVAEQDALYAKGRTMPGPIVTNAPGSSYSSYHQWGTAFDFFRNDGTGAYNEAGQFFERVGAIGIGLGLEWGGNWKTIKDKPHFQLPDWGSSTSGIKKQFSNPEEFRKTWTSQRRLGWQQEHDGWRFYLGDHQPIQNDWFESEGSWYWFDASGRMVTDTWYQYKGDWYYLSGDGRMAKGLWEISGKWYYLDQNGRMATEPVVLTPDQDGSLQFPEMEK